MTGNGTVTGIYVADEATASVRAVESVEAVSGRGLRGDRYFTEEGTFSDVSGDGRDLTLIESEVLEAIERESDVELAPGEHRRNVTTRGVALNHLVGERFRVGDVVCEGARLCEPCEHLQSLTGDEVVSSLVRRGGLRANIVESGTVHVGDDVSAIRE